MLCLCLSALILSFSISVASTPGSKRETIPDYALSYAPYLHLWGEEQYWPSDIAIHLQHVTPAINHVAIARNARLQTLSTFGGDVYLTSNNNVEDSPDWLLSAYGKPDRCGYSSAPATIIVVEKHNGIVDVFYLLFYSYNHGNTFANIRFGSHVGDWEHIMIRFVNEIPSYIFLSAHSGGRAFTYDALTTVNGRAVVYVAGGTHANYVTAGKQNYIAALLGSLSDRTDAGPHWDVIQNYRGFFYDYTNGYLYEAGGDCTAATEETIEGVNWLYFWGIWGDKQYPASDSRQYCILGQCRYAEGPTGPLAKNLGRSSVCEHEPCAVLTSI